MVNISETDRKMWRNDDLEEEEEELEEEEEEGGGGGGGGEGESQKTDTIYKDKESEDYCRL